MRLTLHYLAMLLLLWGTAGAQSRKAGGPPSSKMALERLNRMPAQDRQRLLQKLPPDRKSLVERRLDRYEKMPPETKERLRQEYEQFQQLPPEKQARFRELFRSFNDLPQERRGPVRNAYQRLRSLSPEQRKERLASEQFRSRFSPSEQQLLEHLTDLTSPAPTSSSDN